MAWHVLDTAVLLQGSAPPPGAKATTPEAAAEVSPGGPDARRFAYWQAAGLEVRAASDGGLRAVQGAAERAGSLGRLSAADQSVLALALDLEATLWTDDRTVQDVAGRLGVRWQAVREEGITGRKDWRPRCAGCGRWGGDPARPCDVCGSEVRLRPARN